MNKRPMCPTCERPRKTCLCAEMVEFACNYQLVVLQDPTEARHALSSAPLLAKSISGARLIVGEVFQPESILGRDWRSDSLLVYPGDNCLSPETAKYTPFKNLILLDGTLRKARRLLHLNEWLNDLPRFALADTNASRYRIRKSPRPDGLSTIEAAALTLNALQPDDDFSPILKAFDAMIDHQIKAMGRSTFSRNYPPK